MEKKVILTTIILLISATIAVTAQTAKPNFAGFWELDASKSVLTETRHIESMTLKVEQTEKQLRVESSTKVAPRSDGDTNSDKRTGEGFRGGGSYGMNIYSLDGKEMTSDINNATMTGKVVRQATLAEDGKLSLRVASSLNNQMGSFMMNMSENWELLENGKALKITRYMETSRGATSEELYFTKKSSDTRTERNDDSLNNDSQVPKKITGGVLNGKAIKLVLPAYPPAAKAVKASGAVNVQVTIDEQGNIISASAVSGHPLLRQAAEEAARNSKFAPTLLQGVPVIVTGIIVYSFTP